jgi:hypothetical protein
VLCPILLVGVGEGESQGDSGAETGTGAFGGGITSVLADDVADEEEAEAGALDAGDVAAGDSVEAGEDALELAGLHAYARVCDGEGDGGVVDDGEGAANVDAFGGVFDGVVEDVDDGGAEVFGDAEGLEADGSGDGVEDDAVGGKIVALEGDGDAVGDEGVEVDEGAVLQAVALAKLSGFEDLLDGGEEAVGIGEHDLVELLFLFFGGGAALEGFEIEADTGDGGFELVGDGVEEGVLALVAADLADKKDGVEDDSGDEDGEEDDSENEEGEMTLVVNANDPGDVEGDGEADGEGAKGDEEGDGSAASGDVHGLGEV